MRWGEKVACGEAVAVAARQGTPGIYLSRKSPISKYAGRKSCPHELTQCASSTAKRLTSFLLAQAHSYPEKFAGNIDDFIFPRRMHPPIAHATVFIFQTTLVDAVLLVPGFLSLEICRCDLSVNEVFRSCRILPAEKPRFKNLLLRVFRPVVQVLFFSQ